MAKGYPDWFGMQMFPSYGPFTVLQGIKACPDSVWTDIFSLSAKARIYTGLFTMFSADPGGAPELKLTVDTIDMSWSTIYGMFNRADFVGANDILTLLYYDSTVHKYSWQIKEGITFSTNLKMSIKPLFCGNIGVYYDVSYSRII